MGPPSRSGSSASPSGEQRVFGKRGSGVEALQDKGHNLAKALRREQYRAELSQGAMVASGELRAEQQLEFRKQSNELCALRLELAEVTRQLQAQHETSAAELAQSQANDLVVQQLEQELQVTRAVTRLGSGDGVEARRNLKLVQERLETEEDVAHRLQRAARSIFAEQCPAVDSACAALVRALGGEEWSPHQPSMLPVPFVATTPPIAEWDEPAGAADTPVAESDDAHPARSVGDPTGQPRRRTSSGTALCQAIAQEIADIQTDLPPQPQPEGSVLSTTGHLAVR